MIKPLVEELYNTLEYQEGMDEELDQAKFANILNEPNIIIFVAEAAGVLIGYLTLGINKSLLDVGPTAIIEELMVTEDHRKKGVGKKLVEVAIDKCKQLACSEIGVGTESSNKKAKTFYSNIGFKEIGVIFEKILE